MVVDQIKIKIIQIMILENLQERKEMETKVAEGSLIERKFNATTARNLGTSQMSANSTIKGRERRIVMRLILLKKTQTQTMNQSC